MIQTIEMLMIPMAAATALVVEKLKPYFKNVSPNVLVAIVSLLIGSAEGTYYVLTVNSSTAFKGIAFVILTALVNFAISTFGYDKTKQTIEQIKEMKHG